MVSIEGEEGPQNGRRPKAHVLHRFIAKFLDFLIVAACAKLIPPIGFFAGVTYLLIADGLWEGQSVGKRVIGLQTVRIGEGGAGSFRESILRNVPLAVGWVLGLIPYVGWLLRLCSSLVMIAAFGSGMKSPKPKSWTVYRFLKQQPNS